MQVLPIELGSIIAMVTGISMVPVRLAGLVARLAREPRVEVLARLPGAAWPAGSGNRA